MTNNLDMRSAQTLNVGNSRTYTILPADRLAYASFIVTAGDTVTISDGTASVILTLAANEEVLLNNSITTIVSTIDNVLVFQFKNP